MTDLVALQKANDRRWRVAKVTHLYPMREGYVEELYFPQTSKGVFVER
jgi:hypothetical protein